MLSVTFAPSEDPTEALILSTTAPIDGLQVLKDDRKVMILDGSHRLTALGMVQRSSEAPWANGFILLKCIFRSDGNAISPAEGIKVSKVVEQCDSFV